MAPAAAVTVTAEQDQLGERPAPPPETLGPGVADGAALELTGQHWGTDERPDQCGHYLQNEAVGQKSVAVIEVGDQVTAGDGTCRVAGGRGGVGVVQLKADDPQVHGQRYRAARPCRSTRCGAVAR